MYKGFSTYNRIKKFRVTDIDLVKQNLYNHFNIKKGEKLMQPNFGSIIWNLLFEPLTEEIKAVIIEDVRRVASYDPRCRVTNVVVTQFEYGLQIELDLLYITNNQKDFLRLTFDNNAQRLTRG
jgi:phage baseplate assembly protein W